MYKTLCIFLDSYSCVFSKENCSFEQLNNNAIKWVLKAEEGSKYFLKYVSF